MIYGETPSNPTMAITDLLELGKLAKKHNIFTVCDNTFASPYHCRPIVDFGIDIHFSLVLILTVNYYLILLRRCCALSNEVFGRSFGCGYELSFY